VLDGLEDQMKSLQLEKGEDTATVGGKERKIATGYRATKDGKQKQKEH
jgi:hypothetical protein